MKEVYTTNTIYEYNRYKDIHDLLGNLQFSLPESSHKTHKETLNLLNLIKPKMKLIIDSMKNFMGDSANLDLIYMIQTYLMYSIICMLEIQFGMMGDSVWVIGERSSCEIWQT